MNHKARLILMPFAWLYGGFVYIRNKMFDRGILRSAQFEIPLICVGNLALGGTGKTPMVEMLVKMLKTKYCVATMSRGYKRKSKGFLVAGEMTTTADIGDEPMQIHQKFPEITVSVAEERVMGIPQLLLKKPQTEVIILDDAFQHREVRAGLNILLTDCHHLYAEDRMLPAGNLRDVKSSSGRADIIVVTKCDAGMTSEERKAIERALDPLPQQKIFFSSIAYQQPYHLFSKQIAPLEQNVSVLLVSGISNPRKIESHLREKVAFITLMRYKDHYQFHESDVTDILKRFSQINSEKKIILTTEKDGVRLLSFEKQLKNLPLYVLPMQHAILFNEEKAFQQQILEFISSFNNRWLAETAGHT